MKPTHVLAAVALSVGAAVAQAQTPVVGFSLTGGPYAAIYNVSIGGPSTLTGDVNTAFGTTQVGVSLASVLPGYSSFDADATNGFTFANLAAGSYVLQFTANGASGGAFGGQYNVSAVPEPQTVALMLAGMVMLGTVAKRSRRS